MSRPSGNSPPPVSSLPAHRLIGEEEGALRRRLLPADEVEGIFRRGGCIGSVIHRHRSLSRGMDAARLLIAEHERAGISFPSGTVILADILTGGKGRFRRGWHAPAGGVWMTLVLVNTLLPEFAALLPLAVGTAVCETVRHFGIDARLKWVNDVLVAGEKIAGVLIETVAGPLVAEEYLLVGIGLNVNNDRFPDELAGRATAIKTALGRAIDPAAVAQRLLAKLAWNIGLVHREEERRLARHGTEAEADACPCAVLEAWYGLADTVGRRVRYGFDVMQKPQFDATVLAIDGRGRIVLQLDDGTQVTEQAGEILYIDREHAG